jgi:amidase
MGSLTRRELIQGAIGAAALGVAGLARPASNALPTGLEFSSALTAARAVRDRQVSSLELTKAAFARVDRYNRSINAFAYLLREEALERAQAMDDALMRGAALGPLHGVPVTVKESFGVAGRPCTWGFKDLRTSKAPANSDVVERLLGAGAVLIGATNVPMALADGQTYNEFYGTTNNPWDLKRTPGGSSGGSAAALAAGIGYLSVGSDIGGSIREPASFCGIFGHKPTLDIVSDIGHEPGGVRVSPGFSTLLAVCGPLARDADDLIAALEILAGPNGADAKAWTWRLPPPRQRALKDFRVGYVLDDSWVPVSSEIKPALANAIHVLEHAGAKLTPGWPKGFDVVDLDETYRFMIRAFDFSMVPEKDKAAERARLMASPDPRAKAAFTSFADWQRRNLERLDFRALWQKYFEEVDVFLSPVVFTPAFPHDHREPKADRRITTPEGPRNYWDILRWIEPATLTGCPATSAPIGRTASGLPVGMQVMGPYLEDATAITLAGLLSNELGGFTPPPGFSES